MKICEDDFEARFDKTAGEIARIENLRLIGLSGPTCAGKTTAANKLVAYFSTRGKNVNIISIDDFYYNKEVLFEISRLKGNEKIDYDSIDTIDFDALKTFISEVWHKDEVHCPVFDFTTGKRTGFRTVKIEKGDIFLFEGIQAVYPEVTALFREVGYTSVYISPRSVLNVGGTLFDSNELRLMRRIVRDYNFRGTGPSFTFENWDGVRANEEKNIFPYASSCSFHIDSTFAYEAGILKPYLNRLLADITETSRYYVKASEILKKIEDIEPISGEYIAENSLYHEFI